ncbi:uncharacterized protein LOC126969018 [Leptidea sinapis]|uniref:uncharacterized protein LOC126969018 n=1 Tax=Leptidea sinapis TaxID=189913 RepID=UPI0021C26F67|nr:uncharacterized protein LOC126969018 [Leptidea sinapis]
MSTFHFIKWTVIVCGRRGCESYDPSTHELRYAGDRWTNIATSVTYQLYYYDSKITNALIILHVEDVAADTPAPYVTQSVRVTFYLANDTIDNIIQLSGSPGYVWGRPVIISTADNNHTQHFFNNTYKSNILTIPAARDGKCVLTKVSHRIVQFGDNKQIKCRLHIEKKISSNATNTCDQIQNIIFELLKLNQTIQISAYGDPQYRVNKNWLQPYMFEKQQIYGRFYNEQTILSCSNLVTRIGYVFAYINVGDAIGGEGSEIVQVNVEGGAHNVTLLVEDAVTVTGDMLVTVDTRFIDVVGATVTEYGVAPHLNIHLPKSFFVPSNCADKRAAGPSYVRLTLIFTIMYMNSART